MSHRKNNLKIRLIFKITSLIAVTTILMIGITGVVTYYRFDTQVRTNLDYIQYDILQDVENRLQYLMESSNNFSKNNLVVSGVIDEQHSTTYLTRMLNELCSNTGVAFAVIYDVMGAPMAESNSALLSIFNDKDVRYTLMNGTTHMTYNDGFISIYNPVTYYNAPQAVTAIAVNLRAIFYSMCEHTKNTSVSLFLGDKEIANYGYVEGKKYRKGELKSYKELTALYNLDIGIRYSPTTEMFFRPVSEILIPLLLIGTLFIVISVVAGLKLARDISEPILELVNRVKAIAPGERSHCAPLGSNDELEVLAYAFDEKTDELTNAQSMLKAYSDELRVSNTELEKRVTERTEELVHAKERAEAANVMKSHFLANMSHEIRTPMNAILGFNQLLSRTNPNEKQMEYINKTYQAAHHLLGIINDILDITKIEAGMMTIENTTFHLFDMLNNVKQIIQPKADEKGLTFNMYFQTDMPAHYSGDPLRIGQILINLVMNAVKFTNNGSVSINLCAENQDDDIVLLHFSIVDSGIGMSKETIEKLFKPFQQAENSTARKYGGTGLGLSISRQLAKLMGGSISVESTEGKGSTFTLKIPLKHELKEARTDMRHFPNTKVLAVGFDKNNDNFINYIGSLVETLDVSQDAEDGHTYLDNMALKDSHYNLVFINDIKDITEQILTKLEDTTARFGRIGVALMKTPENLEQIESSFPSIIFNVISPKAETSDILNLIYNSSSEITKMAPELVIKTTPDMITMDKRILIVEDNEVNRQILIELLKQAGISSKALKNGAEAVEHLSEPDNAKKYSLVFMDIQMPILDGYQAAHALMKLPQMKPLPIVALTADAVDESLKKARDAGMVGYITKPYSINKILEAIGKWSKIKVVYHEVNTDDIDDSTPIYGIDKKKWLESYSKDEELFKEALRIFSAHSRQDTQDSLALIREGRLEEARKKTHSFVGAAGACCLTDGYTLAKELDNELINNSSDIPLLIEKAEKMVHEVSKVTEAISSYLSALPAKKETTSDAEPDPDMVHTLIKLLEDGDIGARKFFSNNKDALTVYLDSKALRAVEDNISSFNFNEALELLNKNFSHEEESA